MNSKPTEVSYDECAVHKHRSRVRDSVTARPRPMSKAQDRISRRVCMITSEGGGGVLANTHSNSPRNTTHDFAMSRTDIVCVLRRVKVRGNDLVFSGYDVGSP